jgi:hypothetical protein
MQRRRGWLLTAAVLFALAALFMLYGQEDAELVPAEVKVAFPRRLRPQETERMEARRTLPLLASPAAAKDPDAPPRPRDPLLAAMPQGRGRTAMVLEANALRHSPVGALLLDCLARRGGTRRLEQLREETGVDPLQDLDRVVVTPDGMMLSGNFSGAKMDKLMREALRESYGDKGELFTQPARRVDLPDGGSREREGGVVGVWNRQLLVFGRDAAEVRQALDRVEGRAESGDPAISEEQTYGEIYGVLSAEDLSRLTGNSPMSEEVRKSGARVELHVDASSDVGVVARVAGDDADKVRDLGKSLGGALAAARIKAQAEGDGRLGSLLELARVQPRDGTFNLEVALPLPYLQQQLANCGEDGPFGDDDDDGDAAPAGGAQAAEPATAAER